MCCSFLIFAVLLACTTAFVLNFIVINGCDILKKDCLRYSLDRYSPTEKHCKSLRYLCDKRHYYGSLMYMEPKSINILLSEIFVPLFKVIDKLDKRARDPEIVEMYAWEIENDK